MYIFSSVLMSFIIVLLSLMSVSFFTLWESKLLSGIQSSQGPVFVGIFGLLQPFADGLKLILKSVSVPQGVYYNIYFLASLFSLVLSLLSWSVIPFSSEFMYSDVNLSLIVILAISSLNVYTILFSGWSSNSKYGLLGSLSAGAQMMSYELPMSLALLSIILLNSSASLLNMMYFQEKFQWNIFIALPSFFMFLVTSLAETNSAPFDLPEAESELVAGYNMEYSSMIFALFFLAEYNHIIVMSALMVMMFFGGWSFNCLHYITIDLIMYENWLTMLALMKIYLIDPNVTDWQFVYYVYITLWGSMKSLKVYWLFSFLKIWIFQSFSLFFKTNMVASLFVMISACVPRYKYTQLMKLCWELFIPVSFVFFLFYLIIL